MNEALTEYIKAARDKGHTDPQIHDELVNAGWEASLVVSALSSKDGLFVPPPPPAFGPSQAGGNIGPQAVVQTLSTRGLEYNIMFIALGFAAISLGSVLHSVVNNATGTYDWSGSLVSYAIAALVVSLPIFIWLFLRLKKAETVDPALHNDPSRRKLVQTTLIITFVVGLFNIVGFVYSLINDNATSYVLNADSSSSFGGNLAHLVITLGIAGGIFVYYWRQDHRAGK